MFKDAFFGNSWRHYTQHEFDGEFIIGSGAVESYNPWTYDDGIDTSVFKQIFGNKKFRPISIDAAFASLNCDNVDQVLKWCNHFGFPDKQDAIKYRYRDFRDQVAEFKFLFLLASSSRIANNDELAYIVNEIKSDNKLANLVFAGTPEDIRQDPYTPTNRYIAECLNYKMTENFNPSFQPEGNGIVIRWKVHSLFVLLHFMFGLSLTAGKYPIKCGNVSCSHYFTTQNENKIFCSPECKNHEQQRRYQEREKQKKYNEAWRLIQAGATIKEAAKAVKITAPSLQAFLERPKDIELLKESLKEPRIESPTESEENITNSMRRIKGVFEDEG